jgi:hypothetical protein
MNYRSNYLDNLRKSLGKSFHTYVRSSRANILRSRLKDRELFKTVRAFQSFCTYALRYDKICFFNTARKVGMAITIDLAADKPVSNPKKVISGLGYYHFFRWGKKYSDDSGLILGIDFRESPIPSPSGKQIFRNESPDFMEMYVYGKEWSGREIITPDGFTPLLHVRAPKVKPKTFQELVHEYETSEN